MKREMRNELRIGLLLNSLFILLNQFFAIPDLFLGAIFGLGICLILIGVLPEKSYLALKSWKKSVLYRDRK